VYTTDFGRHINITLQDVLNRGRLICEMNTRLDDLGAVARQRSAQLIIDRSKKFLDRGYAVTFTGDYNSQPNEDAYQIVQNGSESPFFDTTTLFSETRDTRKYRHVKTYTGFDFGEYTKKRIDYMFLPPRYNSPWIVTGVGIWRHISATVLRIATTSQLSQMLF